MAPEAAEMTLVGLCACTHTQTGGQVEPDPGLPVNHEWVAITAREHRVLFRACPISPVVQDRGLSKQQNHKVAGVLEPRRGERPQFSDFTFQNGFGGAAEDTAVCLNELPC